MRTLLAALGLVVGLCGPLRGQGLVVAPHAVYLDHRTRSASITLYNPGAEPVEASVGFLFGYPVTDSAGDFTLYEPAVVDSAMPAASGWIDAFPRRMTIAPLARQTVRLLARPPAGLPDGEYWARVAITAQGGSVPVSGADTTRIRIGLNLEVRTIIPLTYRKGTLQTGVSVRSLRVRPAGDSVVLRARLERQGSSAYIGTARGTLVSEAGRTVASFSEPIAVYYDAEPAFAFATGGLAPGRYRVRLELASERPDIPSELLLRAPPVRDSIEVILP
jgi:hypothetical protein